MPSQKILEGKKEEVKKLSAKIKSAKSIVFVNYRGLTVEQDTELRRALREAGVDYTVVKNTLTRFAVKENSLGGLEKYLTGPTSMAIHNEDPIAPAKVLFEYARKYTNFELKAGVVEGRVIDADEVKTLATLPSRKQLIARVLAGFNTPIAGLVNVLNGNIRGLVVALNAIAMQKS